MRSASSTLLSMKKRNSGDVRQLSFLAPQGDGGEPRAPVLTGRPTRRQLFLQTQFPSDNRASGDNTTQRLCEPRFPHHHHPHLIFKTCVFR